MGWLLVSLDFWFSVHFMVSGCVCKLSKPIYDLTPLPCHAKRAHKMKVYWKKMGFLPENRCFHKKYVKDGNYFQNGMDRPFQRFWKFLEVLWVPDNPIINHPREPQMDGIMNRWSQVGWCRPPVPNYRQGRPPLHASRTHAAKDKCPWRAADVVFQCQTELKKTSQSVYQSIFGLEMGTRWKDCSKMARLKVSTTNHKLRYS